jgi:hypothetical protein
MESGGESVRRSADSTLYVEVLGFVKTTLSCCLGIFSVMPVFRRPPLRGLTRAQK